MAWNGKFQPARFLAGVALVCLASTTAEAAEPKVLGTFKYWSALLLVENDARICYMHGAPLKSAGKYTRRGDTYVQVTHRPQSSIRNEISVTAGYTYRKNSPVTVTIDGRKFSLFTQADTAWTSEENADDTMVAAMRAGRDMVVVGRSSRGTLTTDTYSLSGFTAAHDTISRACGIK